MKKYEFSLQRIRDYKTKLLDKEKNQLRALHMERDRLEGELNQLFEDFEAINDELHQKFCTGTCVQQIRLYEYRKNGIREQSRDVKRQISVMDVAIDRQQRKVFSLKQEVSGLDKLEEKQLEAYNKELRKEQELVISEFVSTELIANHAKTGTE